MMAVRLNRFVIWLLISGTMAIIVFNELITSRCLFKTTTMRELLPGTRVSSEINKQSSDATSSRAANRLCVVANIFNPASFKSRYNQYRLFKKHMDLFDLDLITVELAFDNQSFQVTHASNRNHIQLQTNDVLWYKENLINIGIQRTSTRCTYIAWIDIEVDDTIEALGKFKIVQLFDMVKISMNADNQVHVERSSYGLCVHTNRLINGMDLNPNNGRGPMKTGLCSIGYAWAARTETLLAIGGLFDKAISGSGDRIMSTAFDGKYLKHAVLTKLFPQQLSIEIQKWQENVVKHLGNNTSSLGYVHGSIDHVWHGRLEDRMYDTRRRILKTSKYQFKPKQHLFYDLDGLLHFDPNVRQYYSTKMLAYFKSRKED